MSYPTWPTPLPQPDSVVVTPNPGACYDDTSVQFTATAHWPDLSTTNVTKFVTWTSSNTSVATISSGSLNGGRAVGIAPGTVTITAEYPLYLFAIAYPTG